MAARETCAIAAFGDEGRGASSLTAADAASADPGPFAALLPLADTDVAVSPAIRLERARKEAARLGAQWIFFVRPGERVHSQAFAMVAPAIGRYDAVWGGIGIGETADPEVPKTCRFTCDDLPDAVHMALEWWVGRSHFVRTDALAEVGFDTVAGEAWYADYLIRLWRRGGCLKTAQPFTLAEALPAVDGREKAFIREQLDRHPLFMCVNCRGRQVKLPYTGHNPTIERVQLRGLFFEQRDLEAVAERVGSGARVVDVGANTGNHSVFFAAAMQAERVVVFEPNPVAGRHLSRTVEANGLANVDLSGLGIGIGAQGGRMRLATGRRGHLGTGRLVADEAGEVEVRSLDDVVEGPVDLIKIDVESMELAVLEGARRLIERYRPVILVEVEGARLTLFLALVDDLGYRVERVFADEGYANYLIGPDRVSEH